MYLISRFGYNSFIKLDPNHKVFTKESDILLHALQNLVLFMEEINKLGNELPNPFLHKIVIP